MWEQAPSAFLPALEKIEATVTVITCSDSGNGFLFLKHQRPQLTMSCSEIWNVRDTPHVPAAVRTCAAGSDCGLLFVHRVWGVSMSDAQGRLTLKPRDLCLSLGFV